MTSGDHLVKPPCSKQGQLELATQGSRAVMLLFALFHLLRMLRRSYYEHHFMITTAKAAPSFHIPHFFLDCKYEAQHPLIGSMITSIGRLSLMHSRSLLDCLCPAVLPSQHVSGWLKPSMRARACNRETSSTCLKKASSTSS